MRTTNRNPNQINNARLADLRVLHVRLLFSLQLREKKITITETVIQDTLSGKL